ncbi:hypothetical protein TanjilG_32989 [Lupinus angustifolius]|uniref:RING-type domain-containing protein n=1 Tax=Lupinus angustifolius TaxID=3871 RepID=A0A4P1RND6_LUPAN|nr:hypothetical protein TanjilG_32989 [Lupinus angustifolius]
MKLVYNQLAPFFLLLLQWMDCSCAGFLLHRYLNLFHILIYKRLHGSLEKFDISEEEHSSIEEGSSHGKKKKMMMMIEGDVKLNNVDLQREDECGICLEPCTKMVLPNCCHNMCIRCYRKWNTRSQSCPFCRGSLRRVNSEDLWVLTCDEDVVDVETVSKEDLWRFYLYINKLPKDHPDALFLISEYCLMSESNVTDQISEPDLDPGHEIVHTKSNEVITESTIEEDVNVATNQIIEHVDQNDAVWEDPVAVAEDVKSTEDNLFVDASDEVENEENEEAKVEGDDEVMHQLEGVGDGFTFFNGELEQLRLMLEKVVAEKESIVQEYQEERGAFAQGVFDLHCELKALTGKQSSLDEAEVRDVADVPLKMVKECLEFVKTASEERPKSEATIGNLHELLSMKDREIEDLNTKIAQLTASNESFHISSEAQLEKDRNIEIAIDKTIFSLATVVNQEQLLDSTLRGKVVSVEEGTMLLIEKYNQFLSDIYQLGQTFSEVGLDTREHGNGNILVDACGGLLELKRKEEELAEKLARLEDENRKLVEELDKESATIVSLNTEIGNMKTELEQEKVKTTNTKEKLSMAVTKGKALVQQRDSLKNFLADKSRELEKCLTELQEMKVALEAAELTKEELARSENMVASLQSSLLQSNKNLEQIEEILSHTELDQPEISDIPEKLRWILEDRNMLKGSFLVLCNLKDALSLSDLPEPISSSDLESQMIWLRDAFHTARDNMYSLQEEISAVKEASRNYIDRFSISLLLELQEKEYLQSELTVLMYDFEELSGNNHQLSLEKDQIIKTLVDLAGVNLEDEGIDQTPSSTSMIIDLCSQAIKGQSAHFSRASYVDAEVFETIQSLLYVRDIGLMLYEDIHEEDMLIRGDVNKLSNELKVVSEEVIALKEERSSLLKDLERSEEKSSMLRDKLSMAVKKGKGLVQDRDNLKGLINEKNTEIKQLKFDLQKQESAVSEYRDQIDRLSHDVESIPKLEADLVEIEKERNQFEQFLMDSNNMLQRVVECVDGIVLPSDPVFGEPVEKVKWLAGFVSECQNAKVHVEQELQLITEEAGILESKLAEAQATVKSLEQGLSSSEDSVSRLSEEKTELEHEKARAKEELQKVNEKFDEVNGSTKLLEDALSQAEKDISVLSNEKEQAQVGRLAAETELERAKEEAARHSSELAEANMTIKDLEDKLSQLESNVSSLTEKHNADQVFKTDMEIELKKLQDEAASHATKLEEANATVQSLEDALLKAQDDISALEDADKIAKEEISSLGFKLKSCMDELAGKNGSLENKSVELIGILTDLHVVMEDNALFPRVKQCFERKFETLKDMSLILNKIGDHIVPMTAKGSEGDAMMKEDALVRKAFLDGFENFEVEFDNREIDGTDINTLISSVGKVVKGFQLRNKYIADKFDEFSDSLDEVISPLREKLLETETTIMTIVEDVEVMKDKTSISEKLKEEKENVIATLENNISLLLSACTDATSDLQIEKLNPEVDAQSELQKNSNYVETTENELRNKLKEATDAFELVTDERDLHKNRVLQLESDIQLLQNDCSELRNNLEGYHALEEKLKEKEVEVSSLHSTLLAKDQEAGGFLLSASQTRDLFDKIDRIKTPIAESGDDIEPHTSNPAKKLFYIIDSVTRLQHQIYSLSHDKEELQSTLDSLSHDKEKLQSTLKTNVLVIQDLKEEVKQLNRNWEESKMVKNELSELTFALKKVMDVAGASDWVVDRKSMGMKELIPALEKHIMTILLESENSKSKAQELGVELVGRQKVIDELMTKAKLLEDSLHERASQPEIVQERSIFEAPLLPAGSEITEVEEAPLGKKAVPPVPSAAHARSMRKGSADHLALDINVESAHLINSAYTDDDDKGHAFKSLNTSGFIPKQGKLIADRVDGIWVSGGRVLMSAPRARLGVIGYFLILHLWLLATIL